MLAARGLTAASARQQLRLLSSKLPSTTDKVETKPDQVTHTGQSWDKGDWRLQRFDIAPKQVNPNIAATLIAERVPKDCGHESVVFCDGGHAALGHPRVYINLDKPGYHSCGYCGNRFFNSHVTVTEEHKAIHHLNA